MMRVWRLAMLCVVPGLVSCATVSKLNLLSTADEVAIGQQAAREVEQEVKLYDDPLVEAYIDSLGQLLARNSRRPDLKYHFKVVDTDVVNAFALPGGFLYVNRGLITTAANESELAGVVGHEVGHVVGHHGARQITKQYGLAILVQLAAGASEDRSLARGIAGQFASLGAGLTLLKYGRDAEREADGFAVEEMHASGIDPEGMATFFEKLMALHESEPEGVEVLFSTHPPTDERVANVRAQVQKLPPKPGLKKNSDRFEEIKARILRRHPPKKSTDGGETGSRFRRGRE